MCVCVCTWFLQEACLLEDNPVVLNWGADAVLPPPTLIFCGGWVGKVEGDSTVGKSSPTLSYFGLILIH